MMKMTFTVTVISSISNTDTEEDESDWEDEKFGNIQDFEFDVSTARIKFEINNETSAIDVFFSNFGMRKYST